MTRATPRPPPPPLNSRWPEHANGPKDSSRELLGIDQSDNQYWSIAHLSTQKPAPSWLRKDRTSPASRKSFQTHKDNMPIEYKAKFQGFWNADCLMKLYDIFHISA